MDTPTAIRLGARRLFLLLLISVAIVWPISELAYRLQRDSSDRAPQTIQLVIPAGTAERVATGAGVPAIPEKMAFVLGDTLVVKNEDVADHQLGPLWIPAGTSASLVMEQASRMAFSCSFRPSRYLGLDVKKPTTWTSRLAALLLAAPALALFFFIYSIVLWPLQPRQAGAQGAP